MTLEETLKALRAPFPKELIGKLPATSKRPALDYVGHAAVVDRLNEAAPDWTYTIKPVVVLGIILVSDDKKSRFVTDANGLPHVVAVFGTMTIGGVSRQEVGDVDNFTTYGDELKKAISDFIRRGAMRFGVAIDLWSKEDLMAEQPAASASATASGARAGGRDTFPTSRAAERPEGGSESRSADVRRDSAVASASSGDRPSPEAYGEGVTGEGERPEPGKLALGHHTPGSGEQSPGSTLGPGDPTSPADEGWFSAGDVEEAGPAPAAALPLPDSASEIRDLLVKVLGSETKVRNLLNKVNGTGYSAKTEVHATVEQWQAALDEFERSAVSADGR